MITLLLRAALAGLAAALHPAAAGAAQVLSAPAVDAPPCVDGVLAEWEASGAVTLVPGAPGVGVRGAFAGPQDHRADLYVAWDARCFYVAAAVADDAVDVVHVPPDQHYYAGAAGQRQDAMHFYDYLEVFARGAQKSLGATVWAAPSDGQQPPYRWGSAPGGRPTEDIPAELGSQRRAGGYTFELALPWEWLQVRPQPGAELDLLALLADSDRPGLALGRKVRQGRRCVWWEGSVRLTGTPPGLPPPPATVPAFRPPAAAPASALRPRPAAAASSAPRTDSAAALPPDSAAAPAPSAAPATSTAALRADLRQSLTRTAGVPAPDWVRRIGREQGFSEGQVDSLYGRMRRGLCRLAAEQVSPRSDAIVLDMAQYAGVFRAPTRAFVAGVLGHVVVLLEDGGSSVRTGLADAARQSGVDEARAALLLGSLCSAARETYQSDRVCMASELVDRARRAAGLSEAEARALLQSLARAWGP